MTLACCGPALLRSADVVEVNRSGDSIGGVSLHPRHDMGITMKREFGRSVTKPLTNHTDRHTGFDCDRGMAVSEIVESDPWQVRLIRYPAERCGESSRVDRRSISGAEDIALPAVTIQESLASLLLHVEVSSKHLHGATVEIHGPAPAALRRGDIDLPTDRVERLPDRDASAIEVDIDQSESGNLASPGPRHGE